MTDKQYGMLVAGMTITIVTLAVFKYKVAKLDWTNAMKAAEMTRGAK